MGTLEYYWKVGIPFWWKDTKEVGLMFVGVAFFLLWLLPLGFLATKFPDYFKGRNK